MNTIQFKSVLKAFDVFSKRYVQLNEKYDDVYETYQIGDTKLYISESQELVVENLPFDVAVSIFRDCADYGEYFDIYTSTNNKTCFIQRGDDFYLTLLHVYNCEGAVILISALKDYYLRKASLEEKEVSKQYDILVNVTTDLLKKSYPHITSQDWMKSDDKNGEKYRIAQGRASKNRAVSILKAELRNFERLVNPFENLDAEFDDPKQYLKKVRIDIKPRIVKDRECFSMQIKDRKADRRFARTVRNADGYGYELEYMLEGGLIVHVIYKYGYQHTGNYGELVIAEMYASEGKFFLYEYKFYVTDKIFEFTGADGKTHRYTKEDENDIRNFTLTLAGNIKFANTLAEDITLNNMLKRNNERKREEIRKQED